MLSHFRSAALWTAARACASVCMCDVFVYIRAAAAWVRRRQFEVKVSDMGCKQFPHHHPHSTNVACVKVAPIGSVCVYLCPYVLACVCVCANTARVCMPPVGLHVALDVDAVVTTTSHRNSVSHMRAVYACDARAIKIPENAQGMTTDRATKTRRVCGGGR